MRRPAVNALAFSAFLFLIATGCVVIPVGERRTPVPVEGRPFGEVHYEMVDWKLDRPTGEYLIAMLEGGFAGLTPRRGPIEGWHVDIILEPDLAKGELAGHFAEHPGRASLYVLDDVLFGHTVFIFPWIRRVDRRVSFVVWKGSRPVRTYSYDSDYYLVGGFSSCLALPFSLRNYVRHDMARVARLFLEDAARDGLMGAPENTADAEKEGRYE